MTLSIDWPQEYLEFIRLFNEREFYDAHEVLEDLWVMEVDPLKNFYKGLIQVAAALVHWERGRHDTARRMHALSRKHLAAYPARFEGLDLEGLHARMEELLAAVEGAPPRLELEGAAAIA